VDPSGHLTVNLLPRAASSALVASTRSRARRVSFSAAPEQEVPVSNLDEGAPAAAAGVSDVAGAAPAEASGVPLVGVGWSAGRPDAVVVGSRA